MPNLQRPKETSDNFFYIVQISDNRPPKDNRYSGSLLNNWKEPKTNPKRQYFRFSEHAGIYSCNLVATNCIPKYALPSLT